MGWEVLHLTHWWIGTRRHNSVKDTAPCTAVEGKGNWHLYAAHRLPIQFCTLTTLIIPLQIQTAGGSWRLSLLNQQLEELMGIQKAGGYCNSLRKMWRVHSTGPLSMALLQLCSIQQHINQAWKIMCNTGKQCNKYNSTHMSDDGTAVPKGTT
jgi:hypothetical protein